MNRTLIKNATIINEGRTFTGSVLIEDDKIAAVYEGTIPAESGDATVIDATGKYLLPGAIDDQVHFREPGLTHKRRYRQRKPCCCSRWGDYLHGYAEYEASDDNSCRSGMEIATGS